MRRTGSLTSASEPRKKARSVRFSTRPLGPDARLIINGIKDGGRRRRYVAFLLRTEGLIVAPPEISYPRLLAKIAKDPKLKGQVETQHEPKRLAGYLRRWHPDLFKK